MNKINTLIVEDLPELNEVYCQLLSHEPEICVVGSAHNKEELNHLLEALNIEVIVMDVEMEHPHSGIEYCQEISKRYPDIKIIMLTCHEEEHTILLAFEAGADDYILKSSSLSELITTIKDVHTGNPSIHGHAAGIIRRQMQSYHSQKKQLLQLTI